MSVIRQQEAAQIATARLVSTIAQEAARGAGTTARELRRSTAALRMLATAQRWIEDETRRAYRSCLGEGMPQREAIAIISDELGRPWSPWGDQTELPL